MKSSRLNTRRFMFSPKFTEIVKSDPIILADVGSRGEIEEPWASLSENAIRVIGFEPDESECNRLNRLHSSNRTYLPVALWSFEGKVDVRVANVPSCSSVYPPNFELIKKYDEKYWKPRITERLVMVNCTTLDKVLAGRKLDCDFLKIDTQGAEYEILQGAVASLKSKIFGVLVETWTSEVHWGQHLTGDILSIMSGIGFSLFDVNIAAAWRRQTATTLKLFGKRQIIGLDLLFFKEPTVWLGQTKQLARTIKAAGISEVYGFPDYAVELLNAEAECSPKDTEILRSVKEIIVQNSEAQQCFSQKLKRKLQSLLGIRNVEFPSLHY